LRTGAMENEKEVKEPSANAKPERRHWLHYVAAFALSAVILITALLLLIPSLVPKEDIKHHLEIVLAELLKAPVRVGDINVNLITRDISVEEIYVKSPEQVKTPFHIQLGKVKIHFKVLPLFNNTLEMRVKLSKFAERLKDVPGDITITIPECFKRWPTRAKIHIKVDDFERFKLSELIPEIGPIKINGGYEITVYLWKAEDEKVRANGSVGLHKLTMINATEPQKTLVLDGEWFFQPQSISTKGFTLAAGKSDLKLSMELTEYLEENNPRLDIGIESNEFDADDFLAVFSRAASSPSSPEEAGPAPEQSSPILTLEEKAQLDRILEKLSLQFNMKMKRLVAGNYRGENLNVDLEGRNCVYDFKTLEGDFFDGTISLSGSKTYVKGEPWKCELEVNINDLDAQRLLSAGGLGKLLFATCSVPPSITSLPQIRPEGRLSTQGRIRYLLYDEEAARDETERKEIRMKIRKSLTGSGRTLIENGYLAGPEMPPYLAEAFPGLDLENYSFSSVENNLEIKDGDIKADLRFKGKPLDIYITGTSSAGGSHNYILGFDASSIAAEPLAPGDYRVAILQYLSDESVSEDPVLLFAKPETMVVRLAQLGILASLEQGVMDEKYLNSVLQKLRIDPAKELPEEYKTVREEFQVVSGYTYEKFEEVEQTKAKAGGIVRTMVRIPGAGFKLVRGVLRRVNPLNLLRRSQRKAPRDSSSEKKEAGSD